MTLANVLNLEEKTICLHEGKFRCFEESGEQLIPFLTLENRLAYEDPTIAKSIIESKRASFMILMKKHNVDTVGDIAYNYAPFIGELHKLYPNAKIIFQYRHCKSFVRSCAVISGVDDSPVGWAPANKALSNLEQYIALGRLQPRQEDKSSKSWKNWTYISKNVWLWAETNRLILDSFKAIPKNLVHFMKFEDFKKNPVCSYKKTRKFLGYSQPLKTEIIDILTTRPINARKRQVECITFDNTASQELEVYQEYAVPILRRLGYE